MNISQFGLLLDVIGTVFIFIFGLPSAYIEDTESVGCLSIGSNSDDKKGRLKLNNALIKIMAHAGIGLIIAGFILQFIGSFK